jgi:hypothetical protein
MPVLKYYDGSDWEPVASALQGPTGPTGVAVGLPTGGATGAVLTKQSSADYDTDWETPDYEGAWTTWSPSFTNFTLGNGTIVSKYKTIGKTIVGRIQITFGSTTSITGTVGIGIPVAHNLSFNNDVGIGRYNDTGTTSYRGFLDLDVTNNNFRPFADNVAGTYATLGVINSTIPFTWTTSDTLLFNFIYEAA